MAAYGVIGGFIGGAIAIVITPYIRKYLIKKQKKRKWKEKDFFSYRPLIGALFLFLCMAGCFPLCYSAVVILLADFNMLYFCAFLLLIFSYITVGPWVVSFLGARIIISKERLVIDHAAKMSNKDQHDVKVMQLGRYHLDLRWEDISELRANINYMKIILHNDECYMFPIGWCKEEARAAIARHKQIKPWE